MTETFYRVRSYKTDRSEFGGIIYQSDFNTNSRGQQSQNGSDIAKRIMSDRKWMKELIRNAGSNDNNKRKERRNKNVEVRL